MGALTHVGIDVADLERAETFYSAVLGVKWESAWGQYLAFEPLPSSLIVYLQRVPEKKTSKTRVHIDLTVPDVLAAVETAPNSFESPKPFCFVLQGVREGRDAIRKLGVLRARSRTATP